MKQLIKKDVHFSSINIDILIYCMSHEQAEELKIACANRS